MHFLQPARSLPCNLVASEQSGSAQKRLLASVACSLRREGTLQGKARGAGNPQAEQGGRPPMKQENSPITSSSRFSSLRSVFVLGLFVQQVALEVTLPPRLLALFVRHWIRTGLNFASSPAGGRFVSSLIFLVSAPPGTSRTIRTSRPSTSRLSSAPHRPARASSRIPAPCLQLGGNKRRHGVGRYDVQAGRRSAGIPRALEACGRARPSVQVEDEG